ALLTPVTPSVTVTAPLPAPPALAAPDLPTLTRRLDVVSATLDHVQALEDWLQGHDLTSAIRPDGAIPSPDALHQQLDRWSAQVSLSDTMVTTATAPASAGYTEPARGRWDVVAANTPPQLFAPAATAAAPRVQPRVAASAGRAQAAQESAVSAIALGATLALTGEAGAPTPAGVTLDATLAGAGNPDRATLQSSVSDTTARRVAPNTIVAPLALAPLVTPTVTATATAILSNTATVTATAALSATAAQTTTAAATMSGTVAAGAGTAMASPSPAGTVTGTLTPTLSRSPTATVPDASKSPSATPTSTATPSATASPTGIPTATDSPTETPSATDSP